MQLDAERWACPAHDDLILHEWKTADEADVGELAQRIAKLGLIDQYGTRRSCLDAMTSLITRGEGPGWRACGKRDLDPAILPC